MWATKICSWTSQRWMTAVQYHLKGRSVALKRLTAKVQNASPALLCRVQWGIAVSSGDVPHCSHGQLSAHPMQPLLAPHGGKIRVQLFLPSMSLWACLQCLLRAQGGSAIAHGSVSALKPCCSHSPSGLNASRVSCLMQLKWWVVEELLCASLLSAACYVWHLF